MRNSICWLVLFTFFCNTLNASVKEIIKSNDNFFEAQHLSNMYFDDKYCEDLNGHCDDNEYHKFKRWEWYWRTRVNPAGEKPTYNEVVKTVTQKRQQTRIANNAYFSSEYDWTNINQTFSVSGYDGMGRTTSMAFHPEDPNIFFVGAPNGGLWKTTNGGESYQPLGDQLPYVSVGNILINHQNPDIMYVSVGDHTGWWNYGLGVYKSVDGGVNWEPTEFAKSFTDYYAILEMVMHPENPDILLVASNEGIVKTTDGFETWSTELNGEVNSLVFNASNPNIVYAGRKSNSQSQVYRSEDLGDTWVQVSSLNFPGSNWVELDLAVSPANPNIINVATSTEELYQSTDGGLTFNFVSNLPNNFGIVGMSKTNADVIYTGWLNVYQSNNGGQNWNQLTHWYFNPPFEEVHADQRNVFTSPHHDELIYFCNDGGLYVHNEVENTWTDLSDGLIITQYYKMATAQTDPFYMIGGTQDNGGRMRRADGNWRSTNGGDAMEQAIDPTNENIIYTTYINGLLYRSMDGWISDTYNSISDNIPGMPEGEGTGSWVTPYMLDPTNPQRIIAGYGRVFESLNRGDSWTNISLFLNPGETMDCLNIAPTSPNTIYVGSNDNAYRTYDNGENWEEISLLASDPVTSFSIDSLNDQHVWMTLGAYHQGFKVYESFNGGDSWENISEDLPNVPINCSAFLHYTNTLFVGTDAGVFIRDYNEEEPTWTLYGTNLPFTIVNDIEFQYNYKKLRIATYGRGIYEAPMPNATLSNCLQPQLAFNFESDLTNENGMNGTAPNGQAWDNGWDNACIYLDGEEEFVEVNHYYEANLGSEFTLAFRVKPFALNEQNTLFCKGISNAPYIIRIDENGFIHADFNTNMNSNEFKSFVSNGQIESNEWNHIVIKYDSEELRIFLNGSTDAIFADEFTIGLNSEALAIGYNAITESGYYNGYIDDFKVYCYAFTNSEAIQFTESPCSDFGESCNDNDACTIEDAYDEQCNCKGILIDDNGDGYCDLTSVELLENQQISFYPNPAKNGFVMIDSPIQFDSYAVYTVQGQLLNEAEFYNSNKIEWQSNYSGVMIIQLKNNKRQLNFKLVSE